MSWPQCVNASTAGVAHVPVPNGTRQSTGTLLADTLWGRVVTHICVSKLAIIGSDNGLLPGRRPAIIWANAGILLIPTLGTKFGEILSEIQIFSFKKMHLKMSSAKSEHFVTASMCLTHYLQSNSDFRCFHIIFGDQMTSFTKRSRRSPQPLSW